jgi:hypothetical protein
MRTVPLVFTAAEAAWVDFGAGAQLHATDTSVAIYHQRQLVAQHLGAREIAIRRTVCARACRLRVTDHGSPFYRTVKTLLTCRPQLLHEPSLEHSGPYSSGASFVRDVGNYASTSAPDSRVEEPKIVVSNQLSRVVHLVQPENLSERPEPPLSTSRGRNCETVVWYLYA